MQRFGPELSRVRNASFCLMKGVFRYQKFTDTVPPGLHMKKITDYARNCPRHHMPYFLLSEAHAGSAAGFRSQNWFMSCSTILLMSTPVQYLARTNVMSCASRSSRRLAECQNTHADDRRHCVHHPRVQFGSKEL